MSRRPTRWPRLPAGLVEAALAGHSTFGLVAAALLYVVCLTGVPSVFAKELQQWETPTAPLATRASSERMAEVLEASWRLGLAEGKVGTVMIFGPEPDMPQLRGRAVGDAFERMWAFSADGRQVVPVETPSTRFVTELHGNLHAGVWGDVLVGVSGVALLSLVITGLLSHPRILKDAFRFRRGGSWRLQEADVHNRLSVWATPFHIAVALSGAVLALGTVLGAVIAVIVFSGDMDKAAEALAGEGGPAVAGAAAFPDVAPMARKVEDMDADSEVRFILVSQPGQAGQQVYVDVVSPRQLAAGESFVFTGDGQPRGPAGYFDGPLGQQIRAAMVPLHYGTFGGLALKLVYGILGTGLCVVVSTGVSIWAARRRDRGLPAPIWTRLWIAVAWGQVSALAVAMTAGLAGLDALAVWAGVGLLALGSSGLPTDETQFARAHRLVAAGSLAVVVAAHIALHGVAGRGASPWVNLVLMLMSLGLAVSALRRVGLPPSRPPRLDT